MQIKPIFNKPAGQPIVIAGPCSAETEEQVLRTARDLKALEGAGGPVIDCFRAGIWKPRTRPNSFEGVGKPGLEWLRTVKEETGLKVCTEVANTGHVFQALKHGVDVLWLGARTTVNPFSVQEVADAIEGVDIPVLIKNPINPDLNLWIGAIERVYKAGVTRIGVIHRGFSYHGKSNYRNVPRWQLPIELKRRFPELEIICDNSHICGRRDTLQAVAQKAFDLDFDGIMTEVHPTPDAAWSDAKQQITPATFGELVRALQMRQSDSSDPIFNNRLLQLRGQIDEIDEELFNLLSRRMDVATHIGQYKKENNISILQQARWNDIRKKAIQKGSERGLSEEFMTVLLMGIHQESINHQERVMRTDDSAATADDASQKA